MKAPMLQAYKVLHDFQNKYPAVTKNGTRTVLLTYYSQTCVDVSLHESAKYWPIDKDAPWFEPLVVALLHAQLLGMKVTIKDGITLHDERQTSSPPTADVQ